MPLEANNRRIALGLGLALTLAVLFILSITFFLKISGRENPYGGLDVPILAFLILYTCVGYLLIIRLGINKLGGQTLREIGWSFNSWEKEILAGLFGGFIAVAALYLVGLWGGIWSWQDFYDQQLQCTSGQRVLFLLIGLNAGFIEESLFRGFLQPALCRKLGLISGICVVGLAFALYHLNFQPFAIGGKLVLGLVFGVLRGRNRSLLRPAIAHIVTWVVIGAA